MPSLPRPLRRGARARADGVARPSEPETSNVEQLEAAGLRWINIEHPRPIDRAWIEEHFSFHPLDYEDVFSRNQRPKVDEYDDYLFVVLHFPRYDKTIGRLNAAELDVFVGPDFVITLPNEQDRKSTRLNSSHANISYAVFCLKKKKQTPPSPTT